MGVVDVVLGVEASRPDPVAERWLEYRLEGEFTLGGSDGRRAPLRGVVDRVDLLPDRRVRVIDYKTGSAPNPRRALQVPVYALCAAERLQERDGAAWTVDEAAYVAFSGKRTVVNVVKPGRGEGAEAAAVFESARARVFEALDGIGQGAFPPQPHDPIICTWCAFAGVCRKDYVGDE
jgi:putative RecB family exonuclease